MYSRMSSVVCSAKSANSLIKGCARAAHSATSSAVGASPAISASKYWFINDWISARFSFIQRGKRSFKTSRVFHIWSSSKAY